MLTFLKLGGSFITDKREAFSFNAARVQQAAQQIRAALDTNPDLPLLIGHGSGSFGHTVASMHATIAGVHSAEQWRGFAEVSTAASALNYHVTTCLAEAGIPILRIQPSASARSADGKLQSLALEPITTALAHKLVPLVYGDVSLDAVRGGTIISTEAIFTYLAQQLPVTRILLVGDMPGVYDQQRSIIPEITPASFDTIRPALGGSIGTDVTGGMIAKVQQMLDLIQSVACLTMRNLEVRIFDMSEPGSLTRAILNQAQPGTLIRL